jgi:hypothetical protein
VHRVLTACTFWAALLFVSVSPLFPQNAQAVQGAPTTANPEATVPYLSVSLQNWLDSGSAKAGHSFSARTLNSWANASCTLARDARVYGHIAAVQKTSKTQKTSSLALDFDSAECDGRKGKTPVHLVVVEVIGNATSSDEPMHAEVPTEVRRGIRTNSMSQTADDMDQNPSGDAPPAIIEPGAVLRLSGTKLVPDGGPGKTSLLTATGGNVRLVPGVTVVLSSTDLAPAPVTLDVKE